MSLPGRGVRATPLSESARQYRAAMWFMIVIATASMIGIAAALKGKVPRDLGRVAGLSLVAATTFAIHLSLVGHRRALADRDAQTRNDLVLMLIAQLGRQDDAALERIAAKGGPAGEAATLILKGRSEKRARSSEPSAVNSEQLNTER